MNNIIITRAIAAHHRHCDRNALIFQQPCAALSSVGVDGIISLFNNGGKIAAYRWNGKRLKRLDSERFGRRGAVVDSFYYEDERAA